MMDKHSVFSDGQTITASAYSTWNIPRRGDLFAGKDLPVTGYWRGTLATANTVDVALRGGSYPLIQPDGVAVTVTASGAIVTLASHGLIAGTPVFFTNYGSTGIVNGTVYFVANPTATTFQLSSTEALALAGTSDITPGADDASVNMTQAAQTLDSTGAVTIARWNVIKEFRLRAAPIPEAITFQSHASNGIPAGGTSPLLYLALHYAVAGSNLAGASVTAHFDMKMAGGKKFYPSGITV